VFAGWLVQAYRRVVGIIADAFSRLPSSRVAVSAGLPVPKTMGTFP